MPSILPEDIEKALLVGRVWREDVSGPAIVTLRGGDVVDITCREFPTMRDLLESDDPVANARRAPGPVLCSLGALLEQGAGAPRLLAPIDLQAIKACGVTFAESMLERVIEEAAGGDPDRAETIRRDIVSMIGTDLSTIKPGSAQAELLKQDLIDRSLWSQYLEVGIGPYAEVFTKAQPMSAVGHGAEIGIHEISTWNNPEPEVVLAVAGDGRIVGAMLGNDVNLRDVEGRSALLLGKAKDNNASTALGPFIRLFDEDFSLDDVRATDVGLRVEGEDGFLLEGGSSMSKISRDPVDLVAATIGAHHQYPDGFVIYLGTMYAPVKDRDAPGMGFTHHDGDIVTISAPRLGALVNTVRRSHQCPPWTFGTAALMRNLSARGLI